MRTLPIIITSPKTLVKFEKRFIPEPNTGCSLWLGAINDDGYGLFSLDGKLLLAHRVSWTLNHGPIPEGKLICHTCDMPPCVNDDHLYIGTHASNNADAHRRERNPKVHSVVACRYGHSREIFGYLYNKDGSRRCRECARLTGIRAENKCRERLGDEAFNQRASAYTAKYLSRKGK